MRNLTKTLAILSLLTPVIGHTLGIGDFKLHSALNQNLNAEIPLTLSAGEKPSDIKVGLASASKFDEKGIPWTYFLSKIKFQTVVGANGSVVIKITSKEVLKEPFLNLLLEVSWPKGNLFREFTVLVDPPTDYKESIAPSGIYQNFTPKPQAQTFAKPQVTQPVSPGVQSYTQEKTVTSLHSTTQKPAASPPVTATMQVGSKQVPNFPVLESHYQQNSTVKNSDNYGPTHKNETLWSIAKRFNIKQGASVEQMVIAIYKANPDAFDRNNVHGLRARQILQIPDREAVLSLSRDQVLVELNLQTLAWKNGGAYPAVAKKNPEIPAQSIISPPVSVATKIDTRDNQAKWVNLNNQPKLPVQAPAQVLSTENTPEASKQGTSKQEGSKKNKSVTTTNKITDASLVAQKPLVKNNPVTEEDQAVKAKLTELEKQLAATEKKLELKDKQLEILQKKTKTKQAAPVESVKLETIPEAVKPAVKPEVVKPTVQPEVLKSVQPELVKPVVQPEVAKPVIQPGVVKSVQPEVVKPVIQPEAVKPIAQAEMLKLDVLASPVKSVIPLEVLKTVAQPEPVKSIVQLAIQANPPTTPVVQPVQATSPTAPVAPPVQTTPPTAPVAPPVQVKPPTVPAQTEIKHAHPSAPAVIQPQPETESFLDVDPYYQWVGGIGLVMLSMLGWLWWRKRKISMETNTLGMFTSSSVSKASEPKSALAASIDEDEGLYDIDTVGESTFLSEFSFSDFDTFDTDQGEIDPVSEADVYLAYGRYQQAEELMRDAIKEQTNRDDCKLKLLEIFYASENKSSFETYVKDLINEGKKSDIDFWEKVTEMGSEICPDSVLFSDDATTVKKTEPSNSSLDLKKPEQEIEFDLASFEESFGDDIDSKTNADLLSSDDLDAEFAATKQQTGEIEEFDFGSFALDTEVSGNTSKNSASSELKSSDDNDFDSFDFDSFTMDTTTSAKLSDDDITATDTQQATNNIDFESFDFDFDSLTTDSDKSPELQEDTTLSESQNKKTQDEFETFDFDFSSFAAEPTKSGKEQGDIQESKHEELEILGDFDLSDSDIMELDSTKTIKPVDDIPDTKNLEIETLGDFDLLDSDLFESDSKNTGKLLDDIPDTKNLEIETLGDFDLLDSDLFESDSKNTGKLLDDIPDTKNLEIETLGDFDFDLSDSDLFEADSKKFSETLDEISEPKHKEIETLEDFDLLDSDKFEMESSKTSKVVDSIPVSKSSKIETLDDLDLFDSDSFSTAIQSGDKTSEKAVDLELLENSNTSDFESIDFDSFAMDKTSPNVIEPGAIEIDKPSSLAKNSDTETSFDSLDFDFDSFAMDTQSIDEAGKELDADTHEFEISDEFDFDSNESEIKDFDDFDFSVKEDSAKTNKDVELLTDKYDSFDSDSFDPDFDFELPATVSKQKEPDLQNRFGASDLTDMDELETKLDLARAYIDMGDSEAAKDIAAEVLEKGTEEQKQLAQSIIEYLE